MSEQNFSIEKKDFTNEINKLATTVKENANRVKELGHWPAWVWEESLTARIPLNNDKPAPGFDAGIACSLNLIPQDKQKLAAVLHAAYTPEAVMQIREEAKEMNSDSETAWWLAASSICDEGGVNQEKFIKQIKDFTNLSKNPEQRKQSAETMLNEIKHSFYFDPELGENVPFGTKDGCIQAAYVAGYPFGVQFAENYGLYFIGTYEQSLGLENFAWSDDKDEQGRAKSGPVFGSKQFIKCANKEELKKALEIVKQQFANSK